MATRYEPQPLDALLTVLPSMPRPMLARLTARLIERLDEMDSDPDLEDDDPAGGSVDDVGEVEDYEGGHPNPPHYPPPPRRVAPIDVELGRIRRHLRRVKRRRCMVQS